jgi:hypothetical protein
MTITPAALAAAAPGTGGEKFRLAALRALRTTLQGFGGAIPSAGIGSAMLTTDYWTAFGFSCLAAGVAGAVSFLHNIAEFLPEDPKRTSDA